MDKKTTQHKGLKIITQKIKGKWYSTIFNGGIRSIGETTQTTKTKSIEFAKIIIDGKIEDGYL